MINIRDIITIDDGPDELGEYRVRAGRTITWFYRHELEQLRDELIKLLETK